MGVNDQNTELTSHTRVIMLGQYLQIVEITASFVDGWWLTKLNPISTRSWRDK